MRKVIERKLKEICEEVTTQVNTGSVELSRIRRLAQGLYNLGVESNRYDRFKLDEECYVEVCFSVNKDLNGEVNFFICSDKFGVKVNVLKRPARECPYHTWADVVAREVVKHLGDAEKYFF